MSSKISTSNKIAFMQRFKQVVKYFIFLLSFFNATLIFPVYLGCAEMQESNLFILVCFIFIVLLISLIFGLLFWGPCLFVVSCRFGKSFFLTCLINYILLFFTLLIIRAITAILDFWNIMSLY